MEEARQSRSSMPLLSRLDHLDFIMKYLEGKQNVPKWGNCAVRGQSMPLDMAVREAYFKGSLMDRVASLEHRLFQLFLEMESSSGSGTSSSQTSGYASSSQGSKIEPSSSLPTFNHPNQGQKQEFLVAANRLTVVQEKTTRKAEQGKKKHSNLNNKQSKKDHKPNTDDRSETCKSRKKRVVPHKWPRLKLLGC